MQMFYPMYHHKVGEDQPSLLRIHPERNRMNYDFSRVLTYGDSFVIDSETFREGYGPQASAAVWAVV